jgi:hypothetical protein
VKKYKVVSAPLDLLESEMEQLRTEWAERVANSRITRH